MSEARNLALYHYDGCPFCARVRQAIDEFGIDVELRNTLEDPEHGRALVAATGRRTVPCLRISGDGEDRWLHESADIVAYLEGEFGG